MQITVKGKNLEVTEALREHTDKKLGKLNKYSDSIISADVTFSTERSWHIAEINIHTNNANFRAEEKTADMYASLDSAIEKLEKQLRKQKEKTTRKPVKALENVPYEVPDGIPAFGDVDEENDEDFEDVGLEEDVKLIRRINPKPIYVKDAIMDMESRGFGFSVFVNAATGRVNVVYKCQKGYSLIDTIIK